MNNVLNITGRLKEKRQKQQAEVHRHKIETVQRFVQCSSCHYRCAMCGSHVEHTDSSCPSEISFSDLNLCESCRAEFEDFTKILSGKKGTNVFWHNKEWIKLWSAWLDYIKAIKKFRNSNEFKQVTKSLIVDD